MLQALVYCEDIVCLVNNNKYLTLFNCLIFFFHLFSLVLHSLPLLGFSYHNKLNINLL